MTFFGLIFWFCQKIGHVWSSNIKSRIRLLALHPMLALHPSPVKGILFSVFAGSCGLSLQGCSIPGPASSWGNLAVPPARKEAESPSNLYYWGTDGAICRHVCQKISPCVDGDRAEGVTSTGPGVRIPVGILRYLWVLPPSSKTECWALNSALVEIFSYYSSWFLFSS